MFVLNSKAKQDSFVILICNFADFKVKKRFICIQEKRK